MQHLCVYCDIFYTLAQSKKHNKADATDPKGASVLVLQTAADRQPVHVVWGIPKGYTNPAVLVTAYRPDPARWNTDFKKRKK